MPVPLLKLCPPADALAPDAELLHRFTRQRDEAAFAELVRRHGPAVYRVCRRLAPAIADDAFQAVFLALACGAGSVRAPGAVAGWLFGVAGRVARQMRDAERRRADRERQAGRDKARSATPADPAGHADLAAALDDELSRLPAKLRDPVVLCLVRGRTHDQAAAELGGSARTLRRQLDRAKAVLRARLECRGVVPAVAAALVAGVGAPAVAVPPALARRTVAAAFQFLDGGTAATPAAVVAKGVTANMAKLKASALAASAAAVLVCLGVGWSGEGGPPAPSVPLPPPAGTADVREEKPPLAGTPDTPRPGVPFRAPNFVVYAPTPVMARVIASEAEFHRRTLALKWFGKELPRWSEPCVIRFAQKLAGNGGASVFTFGKGNDGEPALASAGMELHGDFMHALTVTLPHEVTHAVLASFFGRPVPRWADEGMSVLSESDDEQATHDARARDALNGGRALRLKVLLPLGEYPKDVAGFYAQGHSLARFLVNRASAGAPVLKDVPHLGKLFEAGAEDGHRRLTAFVYLGVQGNTAESWGKAAKVVYGIASLDELEQAWLEWLAKPESVLPPKAGRRPPAPPVGPGGADLIPPARLPTASSQPTSSR
jgi:RNA polymerase sigma factor (sigma-70 family)